MRTGGCGVGTFGVAFHRSELLLPAEGTVPPSWPCLPQLPKQAGAGRQAGADPAENNPSSRNKAGKKKTQAERTHSWRQRGAGAIAAFSRSFFPSGLRQI